MVNVLRVYKWWDGSMNLGPNYGGLERLFREGRDLGWGCIARRDWPLCHIYIIKLSCSPLHTVIRKKSILEDVLAPSPRTSFGESESHLQGCSVTGQSLLLLWGALLLTDWVGLLSSPATPAKPTRHFISSQGWEVPQAPLWAHCSSRTLENLPCSTVLLITSVFGSVAVNLFTWEAYCFVWAGVPASQMVIWAQMTCFFFT